jgi:hypothetical protein
MHRPLRNKRGISTGEYIVLLALVLGFILLLFWKTLVPALVDKIETTFEIKKKEPEEQNPPRKPTSGKEEAPEIIGGGSVHGPGSSSPIPIESTEPVKVR